MPSAERWDIFCRVVDNYGDVGVAWRLARQLALEHGKRVRLWLDDLTVLAKLRPEVNPAFDLQYLEDVAIARLRAPFEPTEVADVVVETFGCDPPSEYLLAMAKRRVRPRWINLEYLSAEGWVEGSHGLPSPNPRLPLVKHYFFPGFTARTGGLLRERDLLARREAFQRDAGAQAAFWRGLIGRAPPIGALKVSVFAYAGAPFESLARSLATYPGAMWLLATEGPASLALARKRAPSTRRNGGDGGLRREHEILPIPFMPQDAYDTLLWACDVNFVRGEDSFVRAQWAARPFVWHIYPQDEGAHWIKLAAFLQRYTEGLDCAHAGALTGLWEAWNRRDEPEETAPVPPPLAHAWPAFIARREALEAHAAAWCRRLAAQRDLVDQLVDFGDNVLK